MIRFSDQMELRHAYNVTGCERILPEDEVQGFRSAVDELTRDFKQLATMLLTVIIPDLFNNYVSFVFMNLIPGFSLLFYLFLCEHLCSTVIILSVLSRLEFGEKPCRVFEL